MWLMMRMTRQNLIIRKKNLVSENCLWMDYWLRNQKGGMPFFRRAIFDWSAIWILTFRLDLLPYKEKLKWTAFFDLFQSTVENTLMPSSIGTMPKTFPVSSIPTTTSSREKSSGWNRWKICAISPNLTYNGKYWRLCSSDWVIQWCHR